MGCADLLSSPYSTCLARSAFRNLPNTHTIRSDECVQRTGSPAGLRKSLLLALHAPPANESNNTYRGFRKLRAHEISVNLTTNAATQCKAAARAYYLAKPCVWPPVSPLPAALSLTCKPRAACFAKSEVVPITNIIHQNAISPRESGVTS